MMEEFIMTTIRGEHGHFVVEVSALDPIRGEYGHCVVGDSLHDHNPR